MRIRPLTGQAFIECLPEDKSPSGDIEIPQSLQDKPACGKCSRGIVLEIGPWPKLKNGLTKLPEFKRGDRVIFSFYAGTKLQRNIGEKFRIVPFKDVLAKIDA